MFSAFYTEPSTSVRLDSASGVGTDIDLESDLGLAKTTTVARLDGYFWLGSRGRLDFSLFRYSRDASRTIDRTLEFGDREYPINTVVSTSADVTIFKAAYTFAVVQRQRGFFGVTGGLYTASSRLELNATNLGVDESNDVDAPLPVVGVRGSYAIGDRIALRGSVEWFGVTANKASGRLTDASIGADYSFNDRVALGVAYNDVNVDVSSTNDRGRETNLDWGYGGPLLYLKMNFGD
ncbi:MAG TPA: hypothetical protein VFV10_09660 [Gammaproteobacteria bacterium]|nr:hypothetical protein [Gammaproteobacteria bacterium]